MPDWKEKIRAFYGAHKWTVNLAALGLVLGILMLTINFWRTLLLVALTGVCVLIGTLMDKGGWDMVKAFLDRILPRK